MKALIDVKEEEKKREREGWKDEMNGRGALVAGSEDQALISVQCATPFWKVKSCTEPGSVYLSWLRCA